jgi:hypothetical protein
MPRALLDADIFSEVLKRADQTVVARASAYHREQGRYTVSAITVQEAVVRYSSATPWRPDCVSAAAGHSGPMGGAA